MTVGDFVRAVYNASVDEKLPKEKRYPAIAIGYVKPGGKMVLFGGNQENAYIDIDINDKLILFSAH